MIQSLIWRFRWTFDRKWRAATTKRVRSDQGKAALGQKMFRMTALRRFVMDRL